jgi:hypothetical protein
MMIVNHKAYLDDIVRAMGYDPELVGDEYERIIEAAKVLNRVRVAMVTSHPEKTRSLFICGIGGEHDETGFPNRIGVCIEFGSNVVATYERKDVYCHEGS